MVKKTTSKYGTSRKHRPRATKPAIPAPTATAAADFTRAMMGAERAGILPKSGVK
jgi:hypothetical protein